VTPSRSGPLHQFGAGVTTYKGLKQTQTRSGEWVAISGVGGLGHVAVQCARAMSMHVVAIDIGTEKMRLAQNLGADMVIDTAVENPAETVQKKIGVAHTVLVTAVSLPAFRRAIGMLRRGGTCALVGLPPGATSLSLFLISS
jgi:alcohol dehydrogenase, propanol-preferring